VKVDTTIKVQLLTSKNMLAPIKDQTIPRIELCGAQLLAKLLKQTAADLDFSLDKVLAWSDSSDRTRVDEDTSWTSENLCYTSGPEHYQQSSANQC